MRKVVSVLEETLRRGPVSSMMLRPPLRSLWLMMVSGGLGEGMLRGGVVVDADSCGASDSNVS